MSGYKGEAMSGYKAVPLLGVAALAVVCALLLAGPVPSSSAAGAATDPGPQSTVCPANGLPCCDNTGTLCVSAPTEATVGENITFQIAVTNTTSQSMSGYVTAWLNGYKSVKFNNLAPGTTGEAKMKYKSTIACDYCGWTFSGDLGGLQYQPFVTIDGSVT